MISKHVKKFDRSIQRVLEIIPGFLTWAILLSPIWLGIIYPSLIIIFLIFLTIFWFYMGIRFTYGAFVGYQNYQKELKIDWFQKLKKLDFENLPDKETLPRKLEDLKHFVLIPVVNEPMGVLWPSFESILNQSFPLKQIFLIYTIEEKYSVEVIKNIKNMIKDYEHKFFKILFFVHPKGIAGEAIGVGGANRTWGAKNAVEYLRNQNEDLKEFIFSSLDADHVLHKHYLTRLSHLYLSSDKRNNKFYTTAVHLFNNNHWDVPVFARVEANSVTLGTMSNWAISKEFKETFAAYSCSLQTLVDADFWDVSLGIDDAVFFWRAFFKRKGDFEGVCHWIPYSADAVEAENTFKTYKSLYKQLLRWGWGIIKFPIAIKGFLTEAEIPLSKKILWTIKQLEREVLLINTVFLINFGFAIVTLVNPYVKQSNFAYSLPDLISFIMTVTLIFLIPGTFLRLNIAPPMPKKWNILRKIFTYLEGFAVIVNLLTFSFFPYVDAQTRLLLGKRMKDLYHTPKLRSSNV
jgi:ABC-type multidrug transport system fused ATPase/permease subunit